MSGTIELPHQCPNCKTVEASNHKELEKHFGYRNMPKGATNQSWCRDCRKKS